SPPLLVRRGAAPSFPFTLAYARGAERQKTHLLKSAPCGAARRVTGARASRRSTAAIFYAVTVLLRSDRRDFPSRYPGSIGAALHPIASSHRRQPPHRVRTVTAPPGPWLRA